MCCYPVIINISDCTNFTLIKYAGRKVTGTAAHQSLSVSLGECWLACFDIPGCKTLSYATNNCLLYTGCGDSCTLVTDTAYTTYVRDCVPGNTRACRNCCKKQEKVKQRLIYRDGLCWSLVWYENSWIVMGSALCHEMFTWSSKCFAWEE